jgi:hypothetical protein
MLLFSLAKCSFQLHIDDTMLHPIEPGPLPTGRHLGTDIRIADG